MNTSIRNILREGLILEASKKQILIDKLGFDENSASILDRLCGPLSVWMGNKILDYNRLMTSRPNDTRTPEEIKTNIIVMSRLFVNNNRQNILFYL